MKTNWIYIKIVFLLCLYSNQMFSQDKGRYIEHTMINVPNVGGASSSENLSFITPCSTFFVNDGKAWIKVDLGENYEFGSDNFGIPFEISMDLDLTILTENSSIDPAISFNVQLTNNQPESIIYLDLNQYIDKDNNSTGFSYLDTQIIGVEGTIRNLSNTAATVNTNTDLRVGLNYEINYGIDVSSNTVAGLNYNAIPDSKVIVFNWEDSCDAPGYEFQIVRLYNTGTDTTADQRIITTAIDWKKALSLYIEGANKSIDLTIGEGQGYYAWRVRPIGTFFENTIGNDQNWGTWNELDYTACTTCLFNTDTVSNQVFFFTDPDDSKNFQYSRVFTENNKVSEQVTYATSLNQVRQTQRYIPSKDYKVITQTILDNSGRPTLNTLPVPISGEKINRYKEGFATASGGLYKAVNFDNDDQDDDSLDTYNNPAMIDATGAFEYYSGANTDKRIPDAQGYPFTRVVFSNDGTDRVVEQSGVGKTHMIGNSVDGKTRTTRTLYSTPTEDELVKLFGDEAPNHENVAKIITIDPNNTRSVSYITKEGNTIATGLTFSEDSDVLDSVKDSNVDNTVSGVMDRISNNVKTTDGFMSSKRITILQEETNINISYTITQQILDGLCNDVTFDLDYSLKIDIFDIDSGSIIHSFEQPTLKDLTDTTNDDIDNITVDFGDITLDIGTYYIQKTLIPSDNIKLEVVNAEESLKKLIKPFFNWIIEFSDKIDCEEEMQYLYNDIFHFGQLVFNKELLSDVTTGGDGIRRATVKFDCDGCSQETLYFTGKDPEDPEADDEFLDYYLGAEGELGKQDQYLITISYFEGNGDLVPINYDQVSSLGTIKPIKVSFNTPCCNFAVPIVFTPPFKTPTPEALTAYMGAFRDDQPQVSLPTQVVESTSYYGDGASPLTSENPDNWIQPNVNFLFDDAKNFTYVENDDNTVDLVNKEAYPIDFEGYAISMLHECKSSGDVNYTKENAAEEIYRYMRGWHRPGLLNQMVYHMATDNYGAQECPRDDEQTMDNPATNGFYEVCDFAQDKVFLPGASYTAQELADCWEPIVIEIVNRLCIEPYELDDDGNGNVASSYDEREGDSEGDLSKNIKNFIIRWISKPKLIRRMRRQNINGSGSALDQATSEVDNMVNTFLKCTGYSFGDIVKREYDVDDALIDPVANYGNFEGDFTTQTNSKTDQEYTVYDRNRLAYPGIGDTEGTIDWVYFAIDPIDGDYIPPTAEEIANEVIENKLEGRLAEFFPFVKDPVFAFKYFEYEDGAFPILEGETCYRDPNVCIDDLTGEEFACCGEDVNGDPIPCNFCGIGYITCEETKQDWDCEQRFTFYGLLKNYSEEVIPGLVPINCENYYEATSYVINPDYGKDPEDGVPYVLIFKDNTIPEGSLTGLEYLSVNLFVDYDATGGYITNSLEDFVKVTDLKDLLGNTPGDGVSLVENDAYEMISECQGNCETRKGEFRAALIKMFEDRCYEIGGCKVDTNDNIVPEEDIDVLVDEMIKQCLKQCEIDTYACVDESCRLLGAPTRVDRTDPTSVNKFTLDISFTDFGVSGPVVDPLSSRQGPEGELTQNLTYFDPVTGITTETDATVLIEPTGENGLQKYSFNDSGYPFVTMWDIRQSLTYAQSTRWNQAMEWKVKLDIPSKCDKFGNYNPDLTYTAEGLPNEAVYIYDLKYKVWAVQDFGICTDQEDYVTRENEDGPGDTFVERSEYVLTTKEPYSASNSEGGLSFDIGEFESNGDLFEKKIVATNEGPKVLDEFRMFVDFSVASDVKELRLVTAQGTRILLDPFGVEFTSSEYVQYEYVISNFTQIGNGSNIFDVEENIEFIKTTNKEELDINDLEYTYVINRVESPKTGINVTIDPTN